MPGVTVKTTILPGLPWHVRIHEITSDRRLEAAEGGFAVGLSGREAEKRETGDPQALLIATEYGVSGIRRLYGGGELTVVNPQPDTNLIYPRTALPYVTQTVLPGRTVVASAFYGAKGTEESPLAEAPCAKAERNRLVIYEKAGGKEIFAMPL